MPIATINNILNCLINIKSPIRVIIKKNRWYIILKNSPLRNYLLKFIKA